MHMKMDSLYFLLRLMNMLKVNCVSNCAESMRVLTVTCGNRSGVLDVEKLEKGERTLIHVQFDS